MAVRSTKTRRSKSGVKTKLKDTSVLTGKQKVAIHKMNVSASLGKAKGATTRSLARTGAMAGAVDSVADARAAAAGVKKREQDDLLAKLRDLVDPTKDDTAIDSEIGAPSGGLTKPSSTIGG